MPTVRRHGGKWISPLRRLALYLRDRFTCQYCGRDLTTAKPGQLTLDHLVCHSHGGTDDPINLITACARCNYGRGTRVWYQYAPAGAADRIRRQRRRRLNLRLASAVLNGHTSRAEALR